jgi:hypothetical protein
MAAAANPFDLEDRGGAGPAAPKLARVWTPEEQAEKLHGYLEIPPEYWSEVRYGTHVRYFSKAEGFRPGGFVAKNPFDTKPKGGGVEKRFMKLQNGFSEKAHGYAQWIVAYEDLSRVFIKPDAAVFVMLQSLEVAVKGLNENVRKVAEHSKRLEARLAQLEARR